MSLRTHGVTVLTLLGLGVALPRAAHAQNTVYAISNGGTTLIRFASNNPGGAAAVASFTLNGVPTPLDAIDIRPLTGQMYGYSDATDTLYTVNVKTGALRAVASGVGASATNSPRLGIDFNPLIDRMRVVTETGQNLVYNPNANAAPTVATNLFYAPGDPGTTAPLGPRVIENAYTNNLSGLFATTVQFGIDYGTDTLVRIANNAGTLTTVGSLGVAIDDTAPFVGFDIHTALNGVNTGYAILDATAGSAPTFYRIDLTSGAAIPVGAVGSGITQVHSLATVSAPEPGTVTLAALGIVAMAGAQRRRRWVHG